MSKKSADAQNQISHQDMLLFHMIDRKDLLLMDQEGEEGELHRDEELLTD